MSRIIALPAANASGYEQAGTGPAAAAGTGPFPANGRFARPVRPEITGFSYCLFLPKEMGCVTIPSY
jgi:hypothetical protein